MSDNNANREVTVVDIKMPFISMVVFLVKLSIAAIPALIIVSFILGLLSALFGGLFGGMFGGMFHGFDAEMHRF
ncbi:MAG: hypothetical protein CMI02_01930 [Oceanospirillaceae bacterium]|nr:hypothetical protein [Oceanospirillaceae bacterium]MBT10779.1 hypothetical protein [Oceanospirillaceae bacterium]|tara:strand:+ start:1515 stop:1736 length:222 start_codon:yes stop_codon:yes gene_type:complete